jgi:hypothetical protein
MAQKNINEILPPKPEYVVNTSEFNEMRGRLVAMHREQKHDSADSAKPALKRTPGSGKIDDQAGKDKDDDDRPTLQRREDLL